MEQNTTQAIDQREFLLAKFQAAGEYDFLPEGMLARMLEALIEADEGYMREAGVEDGAVYDDDAAYEALYAALQAGFPEYKMYAMRLSEDYLDYNEEYLEASGQIEWD